MYHETNLLGICFPPLLVYALTAFLLLLPVRWLLSRLRAFRWMENPAIAHMALFMAILAALVTWL